MININHLYKSYGAQTVLRDISLQMEAGQCVAFVGPNGCGKTTLMKSILGLVKAQQGNLLVDGLDVSKSPDYRKHIGFMPQYSCFPTNMTVREVFNTLKEVRGKNNDPDMELYDAFHIDRILDKRTGALSGGMSQKVNAALAFMFKPSTLILDEPTASLDPVAAYILKQKIMKESGKLILVTSHILSELNDIATHVVFMNEGRILFYQSVEELQRRSGSKDISQAAMEHLKNVENE